MRRSTMLILASTFGMLGVAAAAPSASAAVSSYTLADCGASTVNGQTFSAAVGDTLNITFTNCGTFFMSTSATGPYFSTVSVGGNTYLAGQSGGGYVVNLTNAVATNQVLYFSYSPTSGAAAGSFTVSITAGGGGGGSSSGGSTPQPIVQQFGKPTSGTCDAAQPAGLSWAGVSTGGWGESWAEWMNSGKGGAVCTRTLVYSDSLGTWTVG